MSSALTAETVAGWWQAPEARPLDEGVWQAWLAKGRDRERRGRLRANQAVRWGSIAALLIGAALGVQLAPYEIVARLVITAGAVAMMLHTVRERQFAFAAVFGILAALLNPVFPVVAFSGVPERAFAAASAIPFAAARVGGNRKQARDA